MIMIKKSSGLLAALAVMSLAALPAPVQAEAVPAGKLESLRAASAEAYPDANLVIVESERRVRYNEDGTYLDRTRELIRVLTDTGRESMGEISFSYTRQYDDIRIEQARVIKPDGTVIDVPEEQIKDVTHPALTRMNIYDSKVRMKVITFQGLEVGDAIEYVVVDSCFQAPLEGHFDTIELLRGSDPIVVKSISITGPASRPLHHLVKDGTASFSESGDGELVTWTWTVRDVPRIVGEPSMPSYLRFAPRLLVSTIGDWQEISRWWAEMTDSRRESNDSLAALTRKLTEGFETDAEKIEAVYHFVAQKIRYMGLGTGKKAGFEPKPATETLATRYGVCRDVAVLMCSMLDVLGIESYPVLTRAGELVDSEIPNIAFNHAIVAIPDGESYTFADPTVENCPELLLPIENDASMLVCRPEGEDLVTSPHAPATSNMGTISASSRVDSRGTLTSDVTIGTAGIYDYAFRGFIKRFPAAEMQTIWQRIVSEVHPSARLTGISTTDPEDLGTPFGIRFSYQVEDYAIQAGDYLLVKSPVSTNSFELILQNFLSAAGLPEREYPFNLGVTLGSTQEEELVLPDGYKVKSLPETVSMESGSLDYDMRYAAAVPDETSPELNVSYFKQFLIDSKELDPRQYLELKKILRASSRSGRGEIILIRDDESGGTGARRF